MMSRGEMFQIAMGVGGAFGSVIIMLLWRLVGNIVELNQKIAVIVERVDSHERRIGLLEHP